MPAQTNGKNEPAKAAHVNLMTDTIISSIPPDGLRAVLRSILVMDPSFTSVFEKEALHWLRKTTPTSMPQLFLASCSQERTTVKTSQAFEGTQKRIRTMLGCGLGFECLELLRDVVVQASDLKFDQEDEEGEKLMDALANLDGDIVQAFTSASKTMMGENGTREMNDQELGVQQSLLKALEECKAKVESRGMEFMFERGLSVVEEDNF